MDQVRVTRNQPHMTHRSHNPHVVCTRRNTGAAAGMRMPWIGHCRAMPHRRSMVRTTPSVVLLFCICTHPCTHTQGTQCHASANGHHDAPPRRVVVTGLGVVSCLGNDHESFYNNLLAGHSGISMIENWDAGTVCSHVCATHYHRHDKPCSDEYPTRFAGEIKSFDSEGLIAKKMERRLDKSIKYTLVAGKKVTAVLRPAPWVLYILHN